MGTLDAEVIRQFVTDKGLQQIIDVDTPRLVFPENIAETQDIIQPCNEENGTDRKGYIFSRLMSLVLSFVCILTQFKHH